MNSRNKRKLRYRAKNEKGATVRNVSLKEKIFGNYNSFDDNHKKNDIELNISRNNRIWNKFRYSSSTKKYACDIQKLHKSRKSA